MLFFHPAGESHSDRFLQKRSRIFRLEIGRRWLERARGVEGLLFEIVAEVAGANAEGQKQTAPRWLERAKELIRASFSESISPARVALTVGVHPIHLAREFRKHCGRSIGEYVRHLRVEFACREIRETRKPFLEIAAAAG